VNGLTHLCAVPVTFKQFKVETEERINVQTLFCVFTFHRYNKQNKYRYEM